MRTSCHDGASRRRSRPPAARSPTPARESPYGRLAAVGLVCLACCAWVGAASVDGQVLPGEWTTANVTVIDLEEPAISDNYDVHEVMMAEGPGRLYVAVTVYGDHPELAAAGSDAPYLNFYFNLRDRDDRLYRLGLSYNDGYGLAPGLMHLIQYEHHWTDLGSVPFALGSALEVEIPTQMLPAQLLASTPIVVEAPFFLYNVAPGDVNNDGTVNYQDLGILAHNYGKTEGVSWPDGDLSLDGGIDYIDLGMLSSHYGYRAVGGAQYDMYDGAYGTGRNAPLFTVPEPTTILAGLLATACLAGYLRKRTA